LEGVPLELFVEQKICLTFSIERMDMSLNKFASQILPLYAIRLACKDQIDRSRERKKLWDEAAHWFYQEPER
jgi:hypothetical protein